MPNRFRPHTPVVLCDPCDLCGGTDFDRISDRDRRGKPLATVLCRRCGLVRHAQKPTELQLRAFYSDHYRKQYHGEDAPSAKRVMRAWLTAKQAVAKFRPLLPVGARVLDVGTGLGCFVKQLETAGYDALGIEPGSEFQAYSEKKLLAPVRRCELYDLPAASDWDAVVLSHVIEHLPAPVEALQFIHTLLKPNGLLWLSCPNLEAPFTVRGRMFHFAHIYNFTFDTLTLAAESAGFEVHHRFAGQRDGNIDVVYRRVDQRRAVIDPGSYRRVRQALSRAAATRYFARPGYWASRGKRLAYQAYEGATAKSFTRRLLQRVAQDEQGSDLAAAA